MTLRRGETEKRKRLIGLISSVSEEGNLILKNMKGSSVSASPQLRIIHGRIHGREVVYAVSGMGKTNAAHAVTVLIVKYSPDMIILFGVGGAYPESGLKVGDIAVAEKEVYGDEGVFTREGFQGTDIIGIPLLKKGSKKCFNEFPFDKGLIKLVTRHSSFVPNIKIGPFVTVSTCTGTRKRAIELRNRYNAICENMEGAAVVHVCAIYSKPVIEIRGISNIVEERDIERWDIRLGAGNCQKAVMEALRAL
ncbi:MAG: futalosine hydrolase [Nitrospirota bacterium]